MGQRQVATAAKRSWITPKLEILPISEAMRRLIDSKTPTADVIAELDRRLRDGSTEFQAHRS